MAEFKKFVCAPRSVRSYMFQAVIKTFRNDTENIKFFIQLSEIKTRDQLILLNKSITLQIQLLDIIFEFLGWLGGLSTVLV